MNLLVFCGDRWHPASVVRAGLQPIETQYHLDWVEDVSEWDPARLADYPLILFAKSNNITETNEDPWMTPVVEAAFLQYVRAGGNLVVIHSGSAGYTETPVFSHLLGGIFEHHPEQCLVEYAPVPVEPLAKAILPFTKRDEHYFMTMLDPQVEVFLTSSSENGAQSAGWTRREGKGKVGMLTPGHNLDVWLHPSFQTALTNLIEWCLN